MGSWTKMLHVEGALQQKQGVKWLVLRRGPSMAERSITAAVVTSRPTVYRGLLHTISHGVPLTPQCVYFHLHFINRENEAQ